MLKKCSCVLVCLLTFLVMSGSSVYAADPQGYMPPGSTFTPKDTSDLFGGSEKVVHPFLSIAGMYTDNFYNTDDNEKYEYGAIVSPGIWFALPGTVQPLLDVTTDTSASGGLSYSRRINKSKRRFQGYLSYRADFEEYTQRSSENTDNHDIEGLFQVNMRSGLSIEVMNKYVRNHDARSDSLSSKLDKYATNFANLVINYEISPKFTVRADYHNYMVDYTSNRNAPLDRNDNSWSAYAFMKVAPKTSVFVQYEYVDVDYDKDMFSDSSENRGYVGIDWKMTAKSWGRVKAGYGHKSMDKDGYDDVSPFLFEAQLNHEITQKTILTMSANIGTRETNIYTTDSLLEKGLSVTVTDDFTRKLSGFVSLHYVRDDYDGDLTWLGKVDERSDDIYSASLGVDFVPYKWLSTSLSYVYTQRDSNFSSFDYTNNSVYLTVQVFL